MTDPGSLVTLALLGVFRIGGRIVTREILAAMVEDVAVRLRAFDGSPQSSSTSTPKTRSTFARSPTRS